MFDIQGAIEKVRSQLLNEDVAAGEALFGNCDCQMLSQSPTSIEFLVNAVRSDGGNEPLEYSLLLVDDQEGGLDVVLAVARKPVEWDCYAYACLLQYEQELSYLDPKAKIEHKQYTRQGMIERVLGERRQKAENAAYHISWANNIYGDHILTNEQGIRYTVFLRDFEAQTGYSDSWDARINKLGTTKHIMFAFEEMKKNRALFRRLGKTYPFIEVFCDPLNNYRIAWHYLHELPAAEKRLITRYFGQQACIDDEEPKVKQFLGFIEEAQGFDTIRIRPEVAEKVERAFEQSLLRELGQDYHPDYSLLQAELFSYQKEGVEFALFRKVAIIADEMGLGKTLQAIAVAVFKKQVFGFAKTLVVCPATLKAQWKNEIELFTGEKALIVNGTPQEREALYRSGGHYFLIVNYETVMRDSQAINEAGVDFLILDEAQRIKNYETKTASAIKRLQAKHALIITGTPIENRLIDIFSVVSALDPYFFGPLWEFSYQHCLFDSEKPNRIDGYYNLQELNGRLSEILIRREKRQVLDQLPEVRQIDVPVALSPLQAEYHASYAKGVSRIIRKKFLTAFDMQRLQMLLANMRMVCDSTYLVDEKTSESPKLDELRDILIEKLDLPNVGRKVIIFSEWVKVHKLIGQLLRENRVGFAELSGKVPVKARSALIKRFEDDPGCKVFLSTEAGGAGLNLQFADTLINFELPWNPAKKNQRIGRIDRLGQRSNCLTIYNLITSGSIEERIAAGLLVKQNLFEGVLSSSSKTDYVDFSSKGRSQFIEQLEAFITATNDDATFDENVPETPGGITNQEGSVAREEDFAESLDEGFEPSGSATHGSGGPVTDDRETLTGTGGTLAEGEAPTEGGLPATGTPSAVELEQVMSSGMQFLSGLFKMSTGKDLGLENQRIAVNEETGEVTMTFKLPR